MFNFRTQFFVKMCRMMCFMPSCNVGFTTLWVAKYGTIMWPAMAVNCVLVLAAERGRATAQVHVGAGYELGVPYYELEVHT